METVPRKFTCPHKTRLPARSALAQKYRGFSGGFDSSDRVCPLISGRRIGPLYKEQQSHLFSSPALSFVEIIELILPWISVFILNGHREVFSLKSIRKTYRGGDFHQERELLCIEFETAGHDPHLIVNFFS